MRHAMKGEPIELVFCDRSHSEVPCVVSPQNAIQLGLLLIEAGARELGHK